MFDSTAIVPALTQLPPVQLAAFGYLAQYEGKTRNAYEYHLRNWFRWCEGHQLDPLTIDRAYVAVYVRHLSEERGLRASTVSTSMTAVKGFYSYCVIEGLIDRDPAVHVRLPKVQYRKKYPLTEKELRQFRLAAKQIGGRHWVLGEFLVVHGMRISECTGVRIENCRDVERGHRVMRFRRKGGKEETHPLPIPTSMAIDAAAGDRTEGPVIVSIDGYPLHRSSASGLVNTIARRAGLERKFGPHLVRASAITNGLEDWMDMRDAQWFAGHEDPRTTSRHYDLGKQNWDRHPVHMQSARMHV